MGLNSRNFASLINNGNSILTTPNYLWIYHFTFILCHENCCKFEKLIHSVVEIYFMEGRDSL